MISVFVLIVLLLMLMVLAAAFGSMQSEERSCETCAHRNNRGDETPCCDCATTYPKLEKWEKEND